MKSWLRVGIVGVRIAVATTLGGALMVWRSVAMGVAVVVMSAGMARAQWDPVGNGGKAAGAAAGKEVTVRVVDADGKPAAGARVGQVIMWTPKVDEKTGKVVGPSDGPKVAMSGGEAPVADGSGKAMVPGEPLFAYQIPGQVAQIVVLSKDGKSVGLGEVQPGAAEVQVKLRPAVHVSGTFVSPELDQLGRKMPWNSATATRAGQRVAVSYSNNNKFDLLLPAGEYQVQGFGGETYPGEKSIEVREGKTEMNVEIELAASKLAHLFGKPAPELVGIKDWKNGGPVKLADLKGKLVVMDFWGYWCGPCVASMPEMIRLHEKFKDKGLVIIGVHNDTAENFEQVDRRLAKAKAAMWGGKDLPFLLALDGGGDQPIEGTKMTGSGATDAAYGISSYPTTVLIDRDGVLVDEIELRSEEGRKVLAKYLGVEDLGPRAEPTSQPAE